MTDPHAESKFTPELVACRLEQAGATLLALVISGTRPAGIRCFWPEIPGTVADEMLGHVPSAREISAMDQALSWLQLIPQSELRLRKAVGMRMLYRPDRPERQRYVFSWRRVGTELGVTHDTAQTWWLQGIYLITTALNRPLLCATAGRNSRTVLEEIGRIEARRAATSARARRVLAEA